MKNSADGSNTNFSIEQNNELYTLGDNAFKIGKYSEAKKYFKIALEYCPEDCDTWWALGNCFDELKKPKNAEECFRKALEYADEQVQPEILFNLGNSLLDQGKYLATIEVLEQVPRSASIWHRASRNIVLARERLDSE